MKTIIKWYNRDSISDVEMKQARLVADRLSGKKEDTLFQPDDEWKWASLHGGNQMISPIQYGSRTATGVNRMSEFKNLSVPPFGWEPAPQWAKDAKNDDLRREEQE